MCVARVGGDCETCDMPDLVQMRQFFFTSDRKNTKPKIPAYSNKKYAFATTLITGLKG